MQYVGLTLAPNESTFNAVDTTLAETDGVTREAVLDIDWLCDGSVIVMYRLSGDRDAAIDAIEGHENLHSYNATEREDGGFYLFVHTDRGQPLGSLLDLVNEHALLIQRPIEFTDDGVFLTVAGDGEPLRKAFASVPDDVDAEIRRTGEYVPGEAAILTQLTDRQREALETAFEVGYYELPRKGTAKDVAEYLDCTPSTASELLRRAESAIVTALLPR